MGEGIFESKTGPGRWTLITLYGVFLLVPMVVHAIRGVLDRSLCDAVLDDNLKECTETFPDSTRVFQSQFATERECRNMSVLLADHCRTQSDTIIFGGVLLGVGFCCATFLVFALESIMSRFGASAALGECKPRAAYHEPNVTEDEQRKQKAKSMGLDKEQFEQHFPTVLAKCKRCDVVVDVDL